MHRFKEQLKFLILYVRTVSKFEGLLNKLYSSDFLITSSGQPLSLQSSREYVSFSFVPITISAERKRLPRRLSWNEKSTCSVNDMVGPYMTTKCSSFTIWYWNVKMMLSIWINCSDEWNDFVMTFERDPVFEPLKIVRRKISERLESWTPRRNKARPRTRNPNLQKFSKWPSWPFS